MIYALGKIKQGDVPDGKCERTVLLVWQGNGGSWAQVWNYREWATGRREKRASGTKPYGESKFPVIENRRKPSTVGAGSGRGQG